MSTMEQIILYAVPAIILLAPTTALIWHYFAHVRVKKPAYYGKQVQKILKRYALIHKYKVLKDISFQSGKKTAELPHVLLGSFGVLIVTTLDKRGFYYGNAKDRTWIYDNSKTRVEIPNPYLKTQKAIEVMRDLFSKNEIYSVPIEQIIVYDSYVKKSLCFVDNAVTTIRLSKLKGYLQKEKYEKDNGVNVEKVSAFLSANAVQQ